MFGQIDYLEDIQPIFNNNCISCHSGTYGSGALELDSFERLIEGDSNNGPVVLPFNADSSLLYRVLLRDSVIVPNEPICCRMPKNADPLPIDQRTAIHNWINEGALGSSSLTVNPTPTNYKINLKIYPNPFNNFVRISFFSDNKIQKEILIYDMMGALVKSIYLRNIIKGDNYFFGMGRMI